MPASGTSRRCYEPPNLVEQLGVVQVQDITFQSEVTGTEDDLTITVHYNREQGHR